MVEDRGSSGATQAVEVYETIIGLEVHVQLLTKSKMFCHCSADYANAAPNTHVCPICLGMPGVLPTINQQAVVYTIMTALALDCSIPPLAKFDRKNYPYPDLMKGYQISQYDMPLSRNGWLEIDVEGRRKRVGITRVHLEEDTAKLLHRVDAAGQSYSLVDVNRSGVPLMEIVSEPDLRSPEEARQYLIKLRSILQYLGVSTGNMEEGSFRCDANISLRPWGSREFLAKAEVKNMNSFRAVYRALAYEAERQQQVLEEGGIIEQETRGWVEDRGITVSQRSKEYAHDYRYVPEPDLPPLTFTPEWIEEIRAGLPELPDACRDRFVQQYALPPYDAELLTATKATADFFEACLLRQDLPSIAARKKRDQEAATVVITDALKQRAKAISNWILGDLTSYLNASGTDIATSPVGPASLAGLLDIIGQGIVSGRMAREIFAEMLQTGKEAMTIVQERGLTQISDESQIEDVISRVLAQYPQAVADYKAGKQQALSFLVGQVMKETWGRANPGLVNQFLRSKLT